MSELDFWNKSPFARTQQQFTQGNLHHALLVLGAEGSGRETFCHELAQWVLCQNRAETYCGSCKSCSLFEAQSHPDYHFLDLEEENGKLKTQISVDQVRKLIHEMHESAHQSGWKVASIANVKALNSSSFNALLKTLEEPTKNTLILLQTEQLQGVPATIRSRAQLLKLSVDDPQAVREWIKERQGVISQDMEMALKLFPQAPYKAEDFANNGDAFKCSEFLFDMADLLDDKQQPLALADKWQEELVNCVFWWQLIIRDALLLQQAKQQPEVDENLAPIALVDKQQGLDILNAHISCQGMLLLLEKINELQRLIKLKSPVNLMASWQSLLIFCKQIANKYKPL